MLEQANSLLLHQLSDHIAQDGADSIESLIGMTDVSKTHVIQQDLLNDENGHSLAQLGTRLHDPKAEGDDLGREKEVDHLGRVVLHQGPNDPKRCETKVFKRARLGRGVEERIQE